MFACTTVGEQNAGSENLLKQEASCQHGRTITAMVTRAWLWPILAAVALVMVAVTLIFRGDTGQQAVSAILQAQRDIAAIQEVHVEVDPAALRAAEADLLAAHVAFNEERYDAALDAALRASQAAQKLLSNRSSEHNR